MKVYHSNSGVKIVITEPHLKNHLVPTSKRNIKVSGFLALNVTTKLQENMVLKVILDQSMRVSSIHAANVTIKLQQKVLFLSTSSLNMN